MINDECEMKTFIVRYYFTVLCVPCVFLCVLLQFIFCRPVCKKNARCVKQKKIQNENENEIFFKTKMIFFSKRLQLIFSKKFQRKSFDDLRPRG